MQTHFERGGGQHPRDTATPAGLPALLAGLAGAAWCVLQVGGTALDPTSSGWALRGDWAMALLAGSFFQQEPWRLPLGATGAFLHPVGTSLASADAIPWAGLLARLLSPLLPPGVQYLGPWLLLSYTLQGVMGALLTARLTRTRRDALLGGLLFVLAPVLTFRLGHLALCGHWLLLGMLWLHLSPAGSPRAAGGLLLRALLLVAVAAGVHPYLCAMVLALSLALTVRLWWGERRLGGAAAGAWAAGLVGGAAGVMALLGYFEATGGAPGFTHYSANLLTLVDPGGFSRLLPALPVGSGQYEGFGYLGLGVLGLLGLGLLLQRPRGAAAGSGAWPLPRHLWPLLAACALMALYALSSQVRLGPVTVLSARRLVEGVLGPVTEAFRAPGRFIWPLCYLLTAAAVALVLRALRDRPRLATALLAGAVLVQGLDFAPPPPGGRIGGGGHAFTAPAWQQVRGQYAHLVLYPPLLRDGAGAGCEGQAFSDEEASTLGLQALRLGLTTNSGYVARLDGPRARAACEALAAQVARGGLDPSSLYVVHPAAEPAFEAATAGRSVCGRLDGFRVCVAAGGPEGFRAQLASAAAE